LDTRADPDDLYIEQVVEVMGTTIADSSVRVSTEVRNTGAEPVDIGIRYEWDLMIDGIDGSWFAERNPDGSWIDVEAEWASPAFEQFETTDDPASPVLLIFGTVTGPATLTPLPTSPDLLQFASWGSIYGRAFDYTPTGQTVAGSGEDSAVGYYWGDNSSNAITLDAGQGVTVTQYLYATPASPEPVGGEAYLIGKGGVLLPWIALLAATVAGASLLLVRRRRSRAS
jgi:hypothetical protein